jgi:hypothetical protein
MNELIEKLAEQAGLIDKGSNHTAYINFDHEKFAELIVRECIKIVERDDGATELGELLLDHFIDWE